MHEVLADVFSKCWKNVSYCAFGPTLAAKNRMCNGSPQNVQKQAHSSWKCGNGCDISHGRASSPVQGFGNVFLGRLPKPTKTTLPQGRSTSTLLASPKFVTTSLDSRRSARLLWLGTLSIQSGTSNVSSPWKMTSTILLLSLLADQLLRKAPRTASLSVNKTTRQDLIRLCHAFTDASTAMSFPILEWQSSALMSSKVFLSRSVREKDRCCSDKYAS